MISTVQVATLQLCPVSRVTCQQCSARPGPTWPLLSLLVTAAAALRAGPHLDWLEGGEGGGGAGQGGGAAQGGGAGDGGVEGGVVYHGHRGPGARRHRGHGGHVVQGDAEAGKHESW